MVKIIIFTLFLFMHIELYAQKNSVQDSHELLIINGGDSPGANYDVFEKDILSLANFFDERLSTVILNAGGVGKEITAFDSNGQLQRDAIGRLKFFPSIFKKDSLVAIKYNVHKVFKAAKEKKTKYLTVYWGDHGDQEGIALWMDIISYNELQALYGSFPKDTLIRSIHSHCYSGKGLVDATRKIPSKIEELSNFLEQFYFRNRCGFAASASEEISYYGEFSMEGFIQTRKKISNFSLNDIKEYAQTNYQTPFLTSDLFVDDVLTVVCNNQEFFNVEYSIKEINTDNSQFECNNRSNDFINAIKNYCNNDLLEAYKISIEKEVRMKMVSGDLSRLIHKIKNKFLKKESPDLWKTYKTALSQLEKSYASMLLSTEKISEGEIKELISKAEQALSVYDKSLQLVKLTREYNIFFENSLVKLRDQYPRYKEWYQENGGEFIRPQNIENYIGHACYEAQGERLLMSKKIEQAKQELMDQLLKRSDFKKEKELYEAIKRCEESPIG